MFNLVSFSHTWTLRKMQRGARLSLACVIESYRVWNMAVVCLWCRWVSGWSTCPVSRSRRWRRTWMSSMTVWRCTTPATAGRRWRRTTASSALPNPSSGAPSAAHLHTETLDRLGQPTSTHTLDTLQKNHTLFIASTFVRGGSFYQPFIIHATIHYCYSFY